MNNESSTQEMGRGPAGARETGARTAGRAQPFRVGQATTAHLYVEASTASFWRGVADLSALGFHATEADNTLAHLSDTYEHRVQEFRDRMAEYEMQLPALYHVLPLNDASRRRENLEVGLRVGKFVHAVGGGILNLAGGRLSAQGDSAEEFRVFAQAANELGKRLREEYGVRLSYHPEVGLIGQRREELGRIMDSTLPEYLSLCPDTAHLFAAGGDLLEIFRTYRSRLIHVHFKDFDFNWHNDDVTKAGLKGGFVELGEGVVNLPALTDFLISTGYNGWVILELDPPRTTPIETARQQQRYAVEKLKLKIA